LGFVPCPCRVIVKKKKKKKESLSQGKSFTRYVSYFRYSF
jgi:hypothetical protein